MVDLFPCMDRCTPSRNVLMLILWRLAHEVSMRFISGSRSSIDTIIFTCGVFGASLMSSARWFTVAKMTVRPEWLMLSCRNTVSRGRGINNHMAHMYSVSMKDTLEIAADKTE